MNDEALEDFVDEIEAEAAETEHQVVGEKRKDAPSAALQPSKKPKISDDQSKNIRPLRPDILNHLVLGINETIKCIERSIDDLKIRMLMLANVLNTTHHHPEPNHLLPTAPRTPSPSPPLPATRPNGLRTLLFILIPLQSVSPQSLVNPIPQYCATFNSLVYQYAQLTKITKSRIKEKDWGWEDIEEIRVVPTGRVELEMAEMVGLRRLACLGIHVRTSLPAPFESTPLTEHLPL